ncbi:gamma-glutamyl-gamma-aminobutyrate hydrolase family protein [Halopseudomonas nanhaiensis]|uniref:type 1 glutamine amidotransferase n=1 Tax=Halopseudomonas nanhaiensis TaxID=2830842 RepID=UPI001CBD69FB|nr:gamma-glutamyl-gamma-aminobutyrate hydrolase family protein [Halopseudomonas nanhaiensis]UAW96892.1 gamma-glutamyl-gamma-aminobutyrate hydrolase family protein [Halopseudomonas nanhaiensis]
MRAHYLQHAPFEGLGSIESWLREAGYGITATQLYSGDLLPDTDQLDLLIVMGGPMSVNDEAEYPWLGPEKTFIRSVIDAGKPVLGICLGAQLIANVMGSQVYPNGEREIGWFPVQGLAHAGADVFSFPSEAMVLHWHGETFELPYGAVQLARSEACDNQAFQLGRHVIGLQFHLEATPGLLTGFVESSGDDLTPSRYVQSADTILATDSSRLEAASHLMGKVLEYLHGSVTDAI